MAAASVTAPVPTSSPLGRFADVVTAVVSVFAITLAVLTHAGLVGVPNPFVDTIALIAVGVLYGTSRGYSAGKDDTATALIDRGNLNTSLALAAHDRLDKMGAPTAPLDHTGTTIGRPDNGA